MDGFRSSQKLILACLSDGKPRSSRWIIEHTGLSGAAVWNALKRGWQRGLLLRTKSPIFESARVFKGSGGVSKVMRPYHLYVLRPEGVDSLRLDHEFVKYDKKFLDVHKRFCHGTMTNEEGRIVKQGKFSSDPRCLGEFMDGVKEATVVMEAGYCWEPVYEWLEEDGYSVKLAHPLKTKLIAEAKKPMKATLDRNALS